MSAPLTIDELRALKAGDWVWVIIKQPVAGDFPHDGRYYQSANYEFMKNKNKGHVFNGYSGFYPYSAYGTKWGAYKNKEQAEAKGEIVELPTTKVVYRIINKEDPKCAFIRAMLTIDLTIGEILSMEKFGLFIDKAQAEAKLKELKGDMI